MVKIHHRLLVMLLTSMIASTSNSSDYKPFLKMDAFLLGNPVIDSVLQSDEGKFDKEGDQQIGSLWIEAGIRKDQWLLSALYREEYQLDYHPDTADLYNSIENTQTLDTGRTYHVDLQAVRFSAKGIRIAREFTVSPNLKISIGSSLFQSSDLINGHITGLASATSNQDYNFNVDVDYHYNEDTLFDRPNVIASKGTGLSFDLTSTWKINEKLNLSTEIKDLVGAIRWRSAPFTKATATSDVKTFTPEGFVEIEPALQGIEGYDDSYIQHLKPHGDINLSYQYNDRTTALLHSKHYPGQSLFGIGVQKAFKQSQAGIVVWPQTQTVEVKYKQGNFGFSIGLDHLNLSDAQTLWLSFNYR